MDIKPIRTGQDYQTALARADQLMDAELGTPEGEELDVLVDLIEAYESRHVPMGYPSAVEAIGFRMEQDGLSPRDLVPFIGSRAKVSEVLSGKRAITMPMARALHKHLGIPAEVLLKDSEPAVDDPSANLEWGRFPVSEMAKRGWIPDLRDVTQHAKQLVGELIERAGGWQVARAALYRRNDHLRANAKTDPYALQAWCWRVMATANRNPPSTPYEPGTVTPDFLRRVASLSASEDGPRLACDFLAEHGIALVTERHLPRTHLDGAALLLGDGRPVIGLTLRYDRIDSFWFCLLHELAHVGRHIENDSGDAFVDDLSLSTVARDREDPRETEADEWATEALIPHDAWQTSTARENPSPMAVMNLAHMLRVHPAIVAGRVRRERQNYRLLSQFVGTGEVRRQFSTFG